MDPLSLAAGIAGLISLSLSLNQIISEYTSSVKHAAEEASQLANELLALINSLEALSRFLKSQSAQLKPFDKTSALLSTTSVCSSNLNSLQSTLEKFMKVSEGKKWYRKLAWPIKKDKHIEIISTLHRFTQIFHFCMSIDGSELLSKTTNEIAVIRQMQLGSSQEVSEILILIEKLDIRIQGWIHVQQQKIGELHEGQKDNERQKLLDWFSNSSDPSINHNTATKKREPETGLWFLESDDFCNWVNSTGFLWLHGIPGCGKTILCSTIVEAIKEICLAFGDRKLAYFYFDFQKVSNQDVAVLLRSLIRQLCANETEILKVVQELYTKNQQQGHWPTVEELEFTMFTIISHLGGDVYIILDALDELPGNTESPKRKEVLKLIERMVGYGFGNLHILVTSRNELDIRGSLGPLSSKSVSIQSSEVDVDIKKYVRTCLDEDRLRKLPESIKGLIETKLGEGAQGMFRWAFCQMETLRTCSKVSAIRKTLASLPETLDETYDRILADISKHDAEEVRSMLIWLVFSARPLTLQEVAEAAVLRPDSIPIDPEDRLYDPSEVIRMCRSLISVSTEEIFIYGSRSVQDVVRFGHFSVKEYLTSKRSIVSTWTNSAHEYIGNCCVSSLLQLDFPNLTRQFIDENPLLQYAAEHWFTHARQIVSNAEESKVLGNSYELLNCNSHCFLNWLRICDPANPGYLRWSQFEMTLQDVPPPLFYASSLGLYDTTKRLLQASVDVNESFGRCGTSLHGASRHGSYQIVEMLLDHGANCNAYNSDVGTALEAAAAKGHEQVVRLLLQRGADANSPSSRMFDSVLQATLEYCRAKEVAGRIACLLLECGAKVDMPGGFYGPALAIASGYGMEQIVQQLLERGANVNAKGSNKYGNALQQAAAGGHAQTVQRLLEKGAKVDAPGCRKYCSALHAAALSGHGQIFEWLIDRAADINAKGGWEGSALQAAAYRGHYDIVSRLIELGVEVNTHGQGEYDPGPALQIASANGYEQIVLLLIRSGAKVNMQGGRGRDSAHGTPLQAASREGHQQIVQLLLDEAANVNEPGRDYGTALQAAATGGHYEIVQLLLKHGADVNSQGDKEHEKRSPDLERWNFKKHGNALQAASAMGHYQIVQLLIESGADVNAQNEDYGTAMKVALESGRDSIVQLLQSHGAI